MTLAHNFYKLNDKELLVLDVLVNNPWNNTIYSVSILPIRLVITKDWKGNEMYDPRLFTKDSELTRTEVIKQLTNYIIQFRNKSKRSEHLDYQTKLVISIRDMLVKEESNSDEAKAERARIREENRVKRAEKARYRRYGSDCLYSLREMEESAQEYRNMIIGTENIDYDDN